MGLLDGALTDLGGLLVSSNDSNDAENEPASVTSAVVPSHLTGAQDLTSTSRSATATAAKSTATTKPSSGDTSDDELENESDYQEKEKESKTTGSVTPTTNKVLEITTAVSSSSRDALQAVSVSAIEPLFSSTSGSGSKPTLTSGSLTYPAAWTMATSNSVTISTLIIAGPAISASLAEGNRAVADQNIFHAHNKLFPLAVIAVVVAALFFLMTTAFFLIRLLGWNKKRRHRKLTPSFYVDRNTIFEPKFDMIGTSGNIGGATGPYNPIASTVDLHRNGTQSTVNSGQAAYNVAAPGPASTLPSDRFDEGQAYDGAFFPSSQPDNPFLKPGEYYSSTQPTNGRTLLTSSSPTGSQQTHTSGETNDLGSPVPSFNTGRVFAQVEQQPYSGLIPIGIPARGQSIPPPYQTPPARPDRSNLHDEYKFDMLSREPSNGSNLMSRTRAMKAGVRRIGSPSTSEWQEGRRGDGRLNDAESMIGSQVTAKSSRLGKQPTWGSDRI